MTSISKNSALVFATQMGVLLASVIVSIIIARGLGPDGQGGYALLLLAAATILQFGVFGFDDAIVYFSGNCKYGQKKVVGGAFWAAVGLSLFSLAIFGAIYFSGIFRYFFDFGRINGSYLVVAVMTVPFSMSLLLFGAALLGKENIAAYNKANIIQSCVQLALAAGFLIFSKLDLAAALVSYLAGAVSGAIFVFAECVRNYGFDLSFSREIFYNFFRYGMKVYFGNVAQFLNYRLNIFMIAFFLPAAAVGLYSVAVSIAERLWLVPKAVALALFPRIAAIDAVQANEITPKICRHVFFALLMLSAVLALAARYLILLLFGADYLPAISPFLFLLPGAVALGGARILTADLAGRGRPEIGTMSAIISLVAGIFANLILIPKFGIAGAATATSFSYLLSTAVIVVSFSAITKVNPLKLLFLTKNDLADYWRMAAAIKRNIFVKSDNPIK